MAISLQVFVNDCSRFSQCREVDKNMLLVMFLGGPCKKLLEGEEDMTPCSTLVSGATR